MRKERSNDRLRVFGAVHEVAVAIAGVLDPAELARLAAEHARALLEADGVGLYLWDGATFLLRPLYSSDPYPTALGRAYGAGEGVVGRAFQRREAIVVDEYAAWEHALPAAIARGVGSAAATPLLVADRAVGVLEVQRYRPHAHTPTQVDALRLLAAQVAPALEAARLYHASQDELERREAQLRVARRLAAEPDPERVLHSLLAEATQLVGGEHGVVRRWDPHLGGLVPVVGTFSDVAQYPVFDGRQGVSGRAFEERRPVILNDYQRDVGDESPAARAGVCAGLAAPLWHEGRLLGTISILSRDPTKRFTPRDAEALEVLAGIAAATLVGLEHTVELAAANQALRESEERFRALVRSVSDVIAVLGSDGQVQYVSPAAETIWGYALEVLRGRNTLDLVHPEDRTTAEHLLIRAREQPGTALTAGARLRHADGSWRDFELILNNLLDDPAVAGIVATYRDVTERKAFERELTHLAFHDSLTGLPNRALFLDRLSWALVRAERHGWRAAVLFLDLDNFKVVNDSLGHTTGDLALAAVAERLRACLRAEDTAARVGGDEFTVLLEEVADAAHAAKVAERIAAALKAPLTLEGRELFASASIGIALSAPDDHADDVLRNADLALHRAKTSGKARYAVFDPAMAAYATERLEVETDLRHALERGELRLYYQPIVALADARIVGVEALVRWEHPRRGLILPGQFIPVTEETGLIVPLGQWVLEEACRQARRWQERYQSNPPLAVSVNLSARQFQHPTLTEEIRRAVSQAGLDPRTLELEITESVVMQDAEAAEAKLRALKRLGIQVAIDDFGTGYSSLSYLKRFPIDTLKIDRSFVDGVGDEVQDTAIVRSVVALAKALNLSVTAEGVETSVQEAHLKEFGCDRAQGYYFARPLPPEGIDALLRERTGDDLPRLGHSPGRPEGAARAA